MILYPVLRSSTWAVGTVWCSIYKAEILAQPLRHPACKLDNLCIAVCIVACYAVCANTQDAKRAAADEVRDSTQACREKKTNT